VKELGRLDSMKWAAVIIECEWYDAMKNPPGRSGMKPSMIDGSINAQRTYCLASIFTSFLRSPPN